MSRVEGSPKASTLDSKKKLAVLAAVFLIPAIAYAVVTMFPSASNQGYSPEQPIPYSHKLHAGQYKMECMYCHVTADKSAHASVPQAQICMNCHKVVKTDSPWIQKLTKAYNEGIPIQWVRIHELPDHAHFVHSRHVTAGVSCQTCHGPIQEMERVYQYAPLNMGWCLDCHRGRTTPRSVLAKYYPNDPDARGKPVAPINCSTCHY